MGSQKIQNGILKPPLPKGVDFAGNCFRFLPEVSSGKFFVDLERVLFDFRRRVADFYENNTDGFDGKTYKELTATERKKIFEARREFLRKSVENFKSIYDADNQIHIPKTASFRVKDLVESLRNFAKKFENSTLANADLKFLEEIETFYSMARESRNKPLILLENMKVDETFSADFQSATKGWVRKLKKKLLMLTRRFPTVSYTLSHVSAELAHFGL